MKLKILLFTLISGLLYSQNNDLLNFKADNKEIKINFNLITNENKLIINVDIPKNYYGYLESSIANKIKFFADNKEINAIYPKGEKFHNDIIIKGKQEFILNIDIENINFIKANYQLCSEKDNICLPPKSEIIFGEEINNISEKPKNASLLTENNLIENQNILITLIIIFVSGVASIFLPCSYPLLSITISIFSNSSSKDLPLNNFSLKRASIVSKNISLLPTS